MLSRVVERSGRSLFRVWFGQTEHAGEAVAARLAFLGALLECSSVSPLAVDAEDRAHTGRRCATAAYRPEGPLAATANNAHTEHCGLHGG